MINSLYDKFKNWCQTGSVYIISDLHLGDLNCKIMDKNWISPKEQIDIINNMVMKSDYLCLLGDHGKAEWIKEIKTQHRISIYGNHDKKSLYTGLFEEEYTGPLFIADRILLSHEPITLPFCLNIHGHDHNGVEYYEAGCKHINLAANVCNYTPINLGKLIKEGILKDIPSIHRITIDRATGKK